MSAFGHTWLGVPKSASECFLGTFGALKKRQKELKKHFLGHSEPGAQKHSKSTPWADFWLGSLGTPVNCVRDRKLRHIKLCPVILVTGLPGRVPEQKYLYSLGSEDSTEIFDPFICGLRVGTRRLEPSQGASGKTGPLRGL